MVMTTMVLVWEHGRENTPMSKIIAGDKNGERVKVGDVVKVSRSKKLYRIYKIHEVSDGRWSKPYPILEVEPLQPETIFKFEKDIELKKQ